MNKNSNKEVEGTVHKVRRGGTLTFGKRKTDMMFRGTLALILMLMGGALIGNDYLLDIALPRRLVGRLISALFLGSGIMLIKRPCWRVGSEPPQVCRDRTPRRFHDFLIGNSLLQYVIRLVSMLTRPGEMNQEMCDVLELYGGIENDYDNDNDNEKAEASDNRRHSRPCKSAADAQCYAIQAWRIEK